MKRKFNINDNYFNEIDTEEKAYILGFLYADGCHYENQHKIKIDLQRDDEELLFKIKEAIEFEGNILHYNDEFKIFKCDDKIYKCKPISRLSFASENMSLQLKQKGFIANKSKIITFPSNDIISNELQKHFIRGYFDGNGSISYWIANKNTGWKKFNFTICGTTEIINSISEILINRFKCSPDIRPRYKDRDNNNTQLAISGNRQIYKIMNWLYEYATIYLQRKYNKYKILIQENRKIDEKGIEDLPSSCFTPKSVRDLRNNRLYKTVTSAAKHLGKSPSTITDRCKKKSSYLMYEDEFQNLNYNEQNDLLNNFKEAI